MSFPIMHLCVAYKAGLSRFNNRQDFADYILGSLAPDAVHYRNLNDNAFEYTSNLGAAKKITHLCGSINQSWGQIADNDDWNRLIHEFLIKNNDPFSIGYAAHVFTDLYNNTSLWRWFRENYPDRLKQGYNSEYYDDFRKLDLKLYQEYEHINNILDLLSISIAKEMPNLVSKDEVLAIRHNILEVSYKNKPKPDVSSNAFFTFEKIMEFLENAVLYVKNELAI